MDASAVGVCTDDVGMTSLDTTHADNIVFLRGRLAAAPELILLPSGDELLSFRMIVARTGDSAGRAKVDTVDCRLTAARPRRALDKAKVGQELEVQGALRRRFWRGAGGLQSRYEVEVSSAKALRRRNGA